MTVARLKMLSILLAVVVSSASAQQSNTPLKDIGDLFVGRWIGEGAWNIDRPPIGKKGDKVTLYEECRWTADQKAIECDGFVGKLMWKRLIGWDAASKQVKSFQINSDGSFSEGIYVKQGAKLLYTSSVSLSDGRRMEIKNETTFEDNGNTAIDTGSSIIGGKRNEWRDVYKRIAP